MSTENAGLGAAPERAIRRERVSRRAAYARWALETEAELIHQLRSGVTEAYAELWRRNHRAARSFAHRMSAEHADDLTSQAFLVVYQQITIKGGGPRSSFLSYLFAVIRNESIALRRSAETLTTDGHIDRVDDRDVLLEVENRAQAKTLLEAFRALPERWQQALWLCGVVEEDRTSVAAKLGLTPNGVAALYLRARGGLLQQYLMHLVPSALRDDPGHVARLLPAHFARRSSASLARPVVEHLDTCAACRGVESELISTAGVTRGHAPRIAALAA